jgi:hypothetical protein
VNFTFEIELAPPLAPKAGGGTIGVFGIGITQLLKRGVRDRHNVSVNLGSSVRDIIPCDDLDIAVCGAAADLAPPKGTGQQPPDRQMALEMLAKWSTKLQDRSVKGRPWQSSDLKNITWAAPTTQSASCPEAAPGKDVVDGQALAVAAIKARVHKAVSGSESGQGLSL